MIRKIYHLLKRMRKSLSRQYWTAYVKRACKACGEGLKANNRCEVSAPVVVGDHVNFNGMIFRGSGTITIGDYFHSGTDCMMLSENHNYDAGEAIPYDAVRIPKDITIKDFVWLGSRVTVVGGVTIGEGAVIQAGSVVVSDIPDCAIAGGGTSQGF